MWKDKPRDDAGRVLLGVDYPTLRPVVERAEKASTRERLLRAKLNEGGDANLALLAEMVRLRREYAQLFGMKSFADFQLRRRMIEDTAKARRFLDEVRGAVTARELRDLDELRDAKARHLGTPLRRRSSSAGTFPSTANACVASATASTRRRSGRTSRPRKAFAS